jgi:hypothetical protein
MESSTTAPTIHPIWFEYFGGAPNEEAYIRDILDNLEFKHEEKNHEGAIEQCTRCAEWEAEARMEAWANWGQS